MWSSSSYDDYEYVFKFILVGSSGVGKSCLLLQFTDKTINKIHDPTIGSQFGSAIIKVPKRNSVKLRIWDTAGSERFRSMTTSFFRGAAGALLVYDITDRQTFKQIPSWLEDIREHGTENMTIMLLGNKCDLAAKRAVSFEEGQEFAKRHDLLFMECSAKANLNVLQAFVSTAEKICMNIKDGVFEPSDIRSAGNKVSYTCILSRASRNAIRFCFST